jgi:hypothetical protein
MAQDTDEGLAYLQALKRSAPATESATASQYKPGSAERPPGGQEPNPNGIQTFRGSEKRRSARYKCEGSIEIFQEGSDLRTWATFTDISMHGCYVEATATLPVGTDVRIRLQIKGIQVQSKGKIRVTYPSLGMGIAFAEMSEEDRARLKDLLRTISRPSVILGAGFASPAHAHGASDPISLPTDPAAALRALIEFFESRQLLMRDEFLRILRKSQPENHPAK